jgi:hypothetical protein
MAQSNMVSQSLFFRLLPNGFILNMEEIGAPDIHRPGQARVAYIGLPSLILVLDPTVCITYS